MVHWENIAFLRQPLAAHARIANPPNFYQIYRSSICIFVISEFTNLSRWRIIIILIGSIGNFIFIAICSDYKAMIPMVTLVNKIHAR